ncbi:MFS transporter [Streptomyces alanosinicus]|uniref:Non-specific serine/threonine protein kinase n=1 Tax=Streptomyces alanosinicus TaxID=68171 RepID=A0A918YHX1_9ACTN|nr:MFS transporter [Streptomyces alanosinicus]GHE04515.1 hypothetical protein GCM10010339_36370 [Streptomyces alanosinicus]
MDQLRPGDPTGIGPYRLIARLGEGGMGLVYLGRDEGGRTVAVKVVQADYAGHHEFRRRFAREVAAARRVGGSWTAAVLDADPDAAVPWVATQYIPGPDLHSVVAEDFGPLPEHSVHSLANRLAIALRAVHEAGLIHRDLKPSNVLVTVDGPRVIDFGIARAMDSLSGDSLHTRTGMLIGSPGFMSPEQVRGLELTPASDVFCLGAVLVYAATGRLLFGATETGLNAHLFRIAEDEADLTGVPESLAGLVGACLHKDPARRPTPQQVAERTEAERSGEWLPSPVLAQLGRHAARLLDFAPVPRDEPAAGTAVPSDPRAALAGARTAPPQPQPHAPAPQPPAPAPQLRTPVPAPPPPAYVPTVGTPAAGFPAGPRPGRWWGLAALALAQFTVLFEAALGLWPFITRALGLHHALGLAIEGPFTPSLVYSLCFGGLLLLGGHLADLIGPRRTLAAGLVGFASAALLGSAADATGMIVLARGLQGACAALITPSALALVSTGFTEPKERRRAFGLYTTAAVGGTACAMLPTLSLSMNLDWRVAMGAAVPLAAIALVGTLTLVHDGGPRSGARFDALGALLGLAGVAALVYGLGQTHAEGKGWSAPLTVGPIVGGILALAAFLWWQTRAPSPLLAPYIVRDRGRAGCHLALLLSGVGTFTFLGILNFTLQEFHHYALIQVAHSLLLLSGALALGATQVSARLLHRVAPRVLTAAGLTTTGLGLLVLTVLASSGGDSTDMLGLFLTGLGIGTAVMPLYDLATDAIAPQHTGAAAAALTTTQHLGGVLSAALFPVFTYPGSILCVAAVLVLTALITWPLLGARPRTAV